MKKKNRIISALLILVMLLTIIPAGMISTSAAGKTADITVDSVSALPGSTVEINVEIANNPGILGATLKLNYGEGLTLTNATQGEAWDCLTMTKPGKLTSPCKFTWDGQDISPSQIKDGSILKLTFEVAQTVEADSNLPIELTYESGDIVGADLGSVSLNITNGQVSVVNYTPGDVDGNGKVNSLDIINLRRYIAGGYNVVINELAANVNGDTKINTLDVIMIRRFIAGGYTDANGNPLVLLPSPTPHSHNILHVAAKEATTEAEGNIEYWYCSTCGKYFSDAAGNTEIIDKNSVIIPKIIEDGIEIIYHLYNGDTYLESVGVNNPNPDYYVSANGLKLQDLNAKGYVFEGWYDSAGTNGKRVSEIKEGSKEKYELYAHWSQQSYDITYKLYQTPLQPINDNKYLHYTIGKGLADLPNPTLYNYVFLGWYTDDGKEVKSIPAGTTGNITLNAYWTSKRNLAKKITPDGPLVVEDTNEGVVYFAYEIGTIENIPLTDAIWTIQAVSGLSQQRSETVTKQITSSNAETIAKTISNATVDSGTWTLSENWNENTSVTEQWAEQHGMTVEEANSYTKTSSNTTAVTSSSGGTDSQVDNTGTSTLGYNSKSVDREKGVELSAKAHYNVSVEAGGDFGVASVKGTVDTGVEIGGKYDQSQKTTKKTGSDTTTLDTHTHTGTTTWNSGTSSSSTNTASQTSTSKKALSDVITNTKGYGKSYSKGGGSSETQGFSSTNSESVNSSSSITYTTADIHTTTSTYSTDGKSEGCYRLVIAGTMHVFGVVGYDVGSQSFFTYTYNVMDDDTYEFLDYAPDLKFNDNEYGCIPFEIPDDIYNYVCANTCSTIGLSFRTNTTDRTATVSKYTGDDQDVLIPSYITSGGTSYKVTGISSSAFAGKPVRAVKLSRFIDKIPDSAFSGCNSLEEVSGYFTKIGDNAFDGCTSLTKFNVPSTVSSIGANAFNGVGEVIVDVMSKDDAILDTELENPQEENEDDNAYTERINELAYQYNSEVANSIAKAAIASGAKKVVLNLNKTFDGIEYDFDVPAMNSLTINGGKKNFKNFRLKSLAEETTLNEMNINECTSIPLEIHSDVLTLEATNVVSPSFCMLLSEDGVVVNLIRDNLFTSECNKAIVCKNPTFVSLDSPTPGSVATDGILDINGNIYLCGTLHEDDNVDLLSGEIIHLTESEFANYVKGFFTVEFDPNGGSVDVESKEVLMNSQYGDLPVPTRSGFEFLGWFNNDTEVTQDTVFNSGNDVTLKARWRSDWVLENNAPSGAQIDNNKWSYDQRSTTTSSSPTLDGWTQYDSTWVWGSYGGWSGWSRNQYYSSDSRKIETRTVTDRDAYTSYEYYIWRTPNGNGWGTQGFSTNQGTCSIYDHIEINSYLGDTAYGCCGYYQSPNFSSGSANQWFRGDSHWHAAVTHTEWRYADRSKVYTYYFEKYDPKESVTEITAGGNISNVQHWVKYIVK